MSAFFVATVSVKDAEKFREYAGKAMETFRTFQGEIVLRGKAEGNLAGNSHHQAVGIVKFPDMASLNRWYESDAYQAIIPLRNEAAEMDIVKYEQPA
jgi:uncharacterized protein (DUF1330 family)